MSNNIDNLIISVSNALKDFAEGKLTQEKAKDEYKKLYSRYNKLIKKQGKDKTLNKLAGFCYYNNTENFSLLSGIYNLNADKISCIASFGDSGLNPGVTKAISENLDKFSGNQLLQIQPGEDKTFLHNIYLFPFPMGKTGSVIFVSVSSSSFFSEEKFQFLGKLIKNIFSVMMDRSQEPENNCFITISDEVEKYLNDNIDNEHSVRVTLFVFNMLEKIFNHMGMHSIFEASDEILIVLKDIYGYNSKCHTLSTRDYIVLERIRKDDTAKNNKTRPEFQYKNINIPFNSLKIIVDKKESIYSFWNKILTFENYLSTGDIIK
jgi:hypothetical protein